MKNDAAGSTVPFQIAVTHFMPLAQYSVHRTSAHAGDESHFHGCQMWTDGGRIHLFLGQHWLKFVHVYLPSIKPLDIHDKHIEPVS